MLCRYDDSRSLFEECLTLCRAVDAPLQTARALFGLGRSYVVRGELDRASAFHEEALMLSRRAGEHSATRDALAGLGMVAVLRGDLNLAGARFDVVLAFQRDVGDKEGIVGSLWDLGEVALRRNDLDAAEALAREALVRARALHFTMAMLAGVEQVGRIAAARGLAPQAVRLLAAAQALSDARSVAFMVPYYTPRQHEAARAAIRLALGDEAYAAADAAGRALSLEEAIAEALGEQVARVGGRAISAPMCRDAAMLAAPRGAHCAVRATNRCLLMLLDYVLYRVARYRRSLGSRQVLTSMGSSVDVLQRYDATRYDASFLKTGLRYAGKGVAGGFPCPNI